MQGKGLIRTFLVLLVLVCLYYLSFTFLTSRQNSKATKYAKQMVANNEAEDVRSAKAAYLDSIANENVVNLGPLKYTYNECKERQLNLGLDLQGGMSTVLQVSLVDLIKYLSSQTSDATFHKAIDIAIENQKNSDENFVTLFGRAFEQVDPNARLAAIFSTQELKDKVNFNSTNEEVIAVIDEKAKEAVESTFKIIRTRIDQFGVASPNVSLQQNTGRIFVELPGVDNPERVRQLLEATAKLEFWETDENGGAQGIAARMIEADAKLKEILDEEDPARVERLKELNEPINPVNDAVEEGDITETSLMADNSAAALDTTASAVEERSKLSSPLFSLFSPAFVNNGGRQVPQQGAVVGYASKKDTAKVMEYLNKKGVRGIFPATTKFAWDAKPFENEDGAQFMTLYALKSRFSPPRPRMSGDVVNSALGEFSQTGKPVVTMSMNSIGANEWSKMTGDNIGKQVAVVLDNKVYTSPVVNGKISGGNTEISGQFEVRETKDLANILKAGSLPAKTEIIEEAVVGPSLGEESVRSSLLALVLGLVTVLIFMVLYYGNGGIVANIVLLLNLFFIIGVLAAFGAALTLPGMAGIVLTVGMAVDANVLIFERIREELLKGSGIKKAVADGYQKSYSAILDANITTFITGVILAIFGLGPVYGFAVILCIGILSSLFTAIFVARLFFDARLDKGKEPTFSTGISKGAFKNLNIDFISKRRPAYLIAGFLVLLGLTSIAVRGFDFGVDFRGGRNYVVQFDDNINVGDIRSTLTEQFSNQAPVVKSFSTNNQIKITTDYKIDENGSQIDNEVESLLYEGVKGFYKEQPTFEKFKKEYRLSSQKVGPTIADDIKSTSIWATLIALTCIFLYILVRFRKWQYGLGAIIALAVNVAIVMGIFSLGAGILPFTLEIDQAFIAAILTVIGYSINDTVVVFDRIREYLGIYTKQPMKEVINSAVNSTLSRTLITSFTTLFVVLVLFIFGGEVIRGFAFALVLGIVVGTLSSIFIASPIVADLTEPERQRVVYNERAKRSQKKKADVTA